MPREKHANDLYEVELFDEDFFEDSEEWYVYYTVKNKKTQDIVCEGVHMFDESFMEGELEYLSSDERNLVAQTYLQEHVDELLSKRNINTLHPYVKDLVMASVNSTYGMHFVECYEELTDDERELYTQENLEMIRDEVEREGLSNYIEVGDLFMYEKDGEVLKPSYEPIITVYMGVGTLFDLSERKDLALEKTPDALEKLSLEKQLSAASQELPDKMSPKLMERTEWMERT